MFQFTTTTVLNSLKEVNDPSKNLLVIDTNKSVTVKRVGTFKKENVQSIYKAEGHAAELAVAKVDLGEAMKKGAAEGDTLRLYIYVGLSQGSADSRYANDFYHKGKAFSVDFEMKDTAANTATELVKILNKYQVLVYGDPQLKATASDDAITIEALNEYQRFVKVTLEKLDKDAYFEMGDYKSLLELEAQKTAADVTTNGGYYNGKESFGSYSYLLHNLRLPTSANTDAFAVNAPEMPIPGALYNQYTIHYCADRGQLGMHAVGENTKSVTTHVFYVLNTLDTDFFAAIKNLGTVTVVTDDKKAGLNEAAASTSNAASSTKAVKA